MSWEISRLPDLKMIVIKALGKVFLSEVINKFKMAPLVSHDDASPGIMVDLSDATPNWADFDIYMMPIFYEELRVNMRSKIAVSLPKAQRLSIYLSYESLCRKRGFNIRIFDNRENAVKWLC